MTVISNKIRRALLIGQPEFDAFLTYYPAGLQQDPHEHSRSALSMVLAGSLIERVEGREHSAGPGQISAKPCAIAHSDRYGPHGAVLLSFQFRCEEAAAEAIGRAGCYWRRARKEAPALALEATRRSGMQRDLLWDVLSASERQRDERPPEWLRWARAELDEREGLIDIGELAAQAGVHRVHFSRQFVRHYGFAPSAYRQRQMAGRALRAMVDGCLTGAAAAQDAGFSDQSHMARAIRSTFGTTPRRIAALLAS